MWLHMGSVGPKRVVTTNGQYTPPAPYAIVDNSETILHRTDPVFIDAMGTGFSRIAGKGKESDFYGVDADGASFAQFITTWLSRNGRWNSPKYIIGESYGTFRGAVVANMLQQRGVHLNGLNLLSMVLDLSTITFAPGDDRPYIYYLPSYAAVAWYHEALASRPASLGPGNANAPNNQPSPMGRASGAAETLVAAANPRAMPAVTARQRRGSPTMFSACWIVSRTKKASKVSTA